MKRLIIVLLIVWFIIPVSIVAQSQKLHESKIVHQNQFDQLIYETVSNRGDRLIDFSNVGYMGGGVKLPQVPVKIILQSIENATDDAPRINEAITKVSQLPPDQYGLRGAVLLTKGKYFLLSSINIETSGVVLRGEGNHPEGTVLTDNLNEKNNFIKVIGSGVREEIPNTRSEITDEYVPIGTNIIHVAEPEIYSVGDDVCVFRPGTSEWLHTLGTNNIPKDFPQVKDWQPQQYDLAWERKVVSIKGNSITLDAPIVDALNREISKSYLYKYDFRGRISRVGIENIRLESYYDKEIKKDLTLEMVSNGLNSTKPQVEYSKIFSDEQHGWIAVEIDKAENCWVRNVTSVHFGYSCVRINSSAKHVTVQDCEYLDPVSIIQGGRRYSFCIGGQLNLIQRCYSKNGRHDFVLQARTCGPNVFFDCTGENSWSMTEAHHRWSQGCLWDNVIVKGPWSWMQAVNRSSSGTGHGWSGVNMVFWNCDAKFFFIQKPPTGQNFVIGRNHSGTYDYYKSFDYDFTEALNWIEFHAKKKFPYAFGDTIIGDGYIESGDSPVRPKSLYLSQIKDRLGMDAVKNILTDQQIKTFLNGE